MLSRNPRGLAKYFGISLETNTYVAFPRQAASTLTEIEFTLDF